MNFKEKLWSHKYNIKVDSHNSYIFTNLRRQIEFFFGLITLQPVVYRWAQYIYTDPRMTLEKFDLASPEALSARKLQCMTHYEMSVGNGHTHYYPDWVYKVKFIALAVFWLFALAVAGALVFVLYIGSKVVF